ncbi:hypothetical protein PTSG_10511 [Salpingoeca rosetta]|uniref:AP-1 complex subunit gamma n=1 Tax=Salpingoeca rosetta (strain ATCC 50818 / BSB-021) TaxID=946362 RepID=F2UPV6_SALR5|nr:uncharacterized protein PTSG_10511 [Salpingoeca rosetta]EGD79661.1 hypothetical protein PTSG_10511 [Salpingoeca rosetta]|eukprot:XP_004988889.1 hypothetical protein PTSG_10511 [Salpingoeca rosetta]
MLLLDEGKELHLMVTNSLKQDMNNPNPNIAGFALCTLGAIASAEMARDLADEVEKLLRSSSPALKKKATLCAVRLIRKEPELVEQFIPATRSLLSERNHAVLLTGVMLLREMAQLNAGCLESFRRMVPSLVRLLKTLTSSGYSPEYDVHGINDPFLQTSIVRLLQILGHNNDEASEAMNDVLAEIATNTQTTTNVGNAVLYEVVKCIMNIEAEGGLRVLAINNLGKFLLKPDRNIRYVALTTLLSTVQAGGNASEAVQRHRSTIVDCLREPDVTIRRRALSLCFSLINKSNVRGLVGELLDFLHVADREFKAYMVTELLIAADKYAPSPKWHVDTVLEIITTAGGYVQEQGLAEIIQIIAERSEFNQRAVQVLFRAITTANTGAQSLLQAASWCIGEFGDLLVNGGPLPASTRTVTSSARDDAGEVPAPTAGEVIEVLHRLIQDPTNSAGTRHYAINALVKLSTRLPNEAERIRNIISLYRRSIDEEMQQRSAEYTTLFDTFNAIRPAVLERMPVAQSKARTVVTTDLENHQQQQQQGGAIAAPAQQQQGGDLLDLLGDEPSQQQQQQQPAAGGGVDLLGDLDFGGAPATQQQQQQQQASSSSSGGLDDLLGGLLGGPTQQQQQQQQQGTGSGGLDDLLGGLLGGPSQPAAQPQQPQQPPQPQAGGLDFLMDMGAPQQQQQSAAVSFVAFEGDGLKLTFFPSRGAQPGTYEIKMVATNTSATQLSQVNIQVAVPKTCQVRLNAPSSTALEPFGAGPDITQLAHVTAPQGEKLRVLLRVSYSVGGGPVTVKQQAVSNFPENM